MDEVGQKKLATVEEYIAACPPERREILERVRQVIREAAPEAIERMSWQMPTYWQGENLVHFANQKHHIGFYPAAEAVETFADRLGEYSHSKGTIRFPVSKPIPYELIAEITRYRVARVTGER